MKAYEEIIELIATGSSPQTISDFTPSRETKFRVSELLQKEKEEFLTPEEQSELNHYMEIEHIMRMAKSRARQILQNA